MMRSDGFYWVEWASGPEVWLWQDGIWWQPGGDMGWDDEDVDVLDGPLEPPASKP